jgi:FkbM family methyltransferase
LQLKEPLDIKLIRSSLKHWPFTRGKGYLLRFFGNRINRDFFMEVEPGLLIPAELNDYMQFWCFVGDHEKDSGFQFSLSMIKEGATVIDIGANIGLWALGAARRTGPKGVVHAFEPVPRNYEKLVRNLNLNQISCVKAHKTGLSDVAGEALIYDTSNGNSGGASLAQRTGVDKPITINLMTLDRFCEEQNIQKVDLIKIDVEGAEILVLRGARNLLMREDAPAIFFEVSETLSAHFNSSSRTIKTLLKECGYEIFRLTDKRLERVSIDETHSHEDLFAL